MEANEKCINYSQILIQIFSLSVLKLCQKIVCIIGVVSIALTLLTILFSGSDATTAQYLLEACGDDYDMAVTMFSESQPTTQRQVSCSLH